LIAVGALAVSIQDLVKSDNRVVRYLRETRAEIAKVAWPTVDEARNLSLIVLGVTVAMSFALGFADFIFSRLVEALLRIFGQ
jgi:preprotein translocase subunit SecE